MFLSGFEINPSSLKISNDEKSNSGGKPLFLGLFIFLGTVFLALIFSTVLYLTGLFQNILLTSLIFSTTSLGIVLSILKERQITEKPIGQVILIGALLADFSTLFLLPLIMFLAKSSGDFTILYTLILVALFVLMYFLGKLLKHVNFESPIMKSSQITTRMVVSVLLIFVAIATKFGIEYILGAFMAGLLFSLLLKDYNPEFKESLNEKLDSIGFGFLTPVFFIMIGVNFDLSSVLTAKTLVILPFFVIIAYIVKVVPSYIFLKKVYGGKIALSAGFLLSSRLSLIIALSMIALKNNIITNDIYSTLVMVAIITCLFSPIISLKLMSGSK